jgi:AcrR family transcriptional regulator
MANQYHLLQDDEREMMSETRMKLLLAAADEIANQGFDKANVNRIAEVAGFSIGTFYNYFPSKRALIIAFIEEMSQFHVNYILERVEREKSSQGQVEVFFNAGFSFIEDNLIHSRAIFNILNGADEEFNEQLFQAFQPLFGLLSETISQGVEQGIFQARDLESTVTLIMLIYLGAGAQLNREGKHWLQPNHVSTFILNSLQS